MEIENKKPQFILPPYKKGTDYFRLFCDSEKNYKPYEYLKYDVYSVWVSSIEGPYALKTDDKFFYKMYWANMFKYGDKSSSKADAALIKKLNSVPEDNGIIWAFVTLGFDDNKITAKKHYEISKYVFDNLDFIAPGSSMVIEKHRRDKDTGQTVIHHHTHMLIHFDVKLEPSRVIDRIFKTKGVSLVMRDKNKVDYIGPQKPKKHYSDYQVYHNYVRGVKCAEKMPFVEMDGVWRAQHEIPDLFEK